MDVIYAEDEILFREMVIPTLQTAGIPKQNIYEAETGIEALEQLEKMQSGSQTDPVLMLLDMRMPVMDGRTCAQRVRELMSQNKLRRPPFMVCFSADFCKFAWSESSDSFHITMPKYFGKSEVKVLIDEARKWALDNCAPTECAEESFKRTISSDPTCFDVIVADDQPICRMALVTALEMAGANDDDVKEADSLEEADGFLREAAGRDASRPLLLILGQATWLEAIQRLDMGDRKPFIVSTTVAPGGIAGTGYHASLPPKFQKDDIKDMLAQCATWWGQRC
mmetsp:Transcript_76052/g.211371  ORF Transcript_76052/g.211371 Transcript_76052/m.211371 type:complete len:281 (-) Transcript_76052:104-946(-)